MAIQPSWMNRGKTLYIPNFFSVTLGDPGGDPPPGSIDTSGLELLSFHLVLKLHGLALEGSTFGFVLNGTNDGDNTPGAMVYGPVPLLADKIDGASPPSISLPTITLDVVEGAFSPVSADSSKVPLLIAGRAHLWRKCQCLSTSQPR